MAWVGDGGGGGLYADDSSVVTIVRSSFTQNVAEWFTGGRQGSGHGGGVRIKRAVSATAVGKVHALKPQPCLLFWLCPGK